MDFSLTFRFVEDKLNGRLIALLNKNRIKHWVDKQGLIHYSQADDERVENDLIASIRKAIFPHWQTVSCPKGWDHRFQNYMKAHDVPFKEEITDGNLGFLIPRKFRPHRWKLMDDSQK